MSEESFSLSVSPIEYTEDISAPDIPKEFTEAKLFIYSGTRELVAFKNNHEDFWHVKTVRCNQCGECCMAMNYRNWPYPYDDEGNCSKLRRCGDKWECTAGLEAPKRCLEDPNPEIVPSCCIRYKKVPIKK